MIPEPIPEGGSSRPSRALVLYNPVAGAGRAARLAEQACRVLEKRGFQARALATPGPGGAELLARQHGGGLDLLVVAGGDGSIREALVGLGEERRRVPVGVLPCGNANVVARELGVPLDDGGALAVLREGSPRSIDLAHANGELFLAMVGVGWDASTVRHLSRIRRTRLGGAWYRWWADSVYLLAGLLAAFSWRLGRLRLQVDGRAAVRRYRAIVIANFRCYGKGWVMVPEADSASGQLHYQARKRAGFVFVLWQVLAAMLRRRCPRFVSDYGHGTELVVESEQPVAVQVDGDERGETTRLVVRVEPGAARILAARR